MTNPVKKWVNLPKLQKELKLDEVEARVLERVDGLLGRVGLVRKTVHESALKEARKAKRKARRRPVAKKRKTSTKKKTTQKRA